MSSININDWEKIDVHEGQLYHFRRKIAPKLSIEIRIADEEKFAHGEPSVIRIIFKNQNAEAYFLIAAIESTGPDLINGDRFFIMADGRFIQTKIQPTYRFASFRHWVIKGIEPYSELVFDTTIQRSEHGVRVGEGLLYMIPKQAGDLYFGYYGTRSNSIAITPFEGERAKLDLE